VKRSVRSCVLLAFTTLIVPCAIAADKKISRSQLPKEVQKTVDEQTKGATIRGYSKEIESGQLEYEVELQVGGHSKDVSIAPDGKVLEIEEQVEMESLPQNVRAALEERGKGGKITKIESITKHGAIVAYEAQVSRSGKHSEIQVSPQGPALDHEE
jgi:hypothetical protein